MSNKITYRKLELLDLPIIKDFLIDFLATIKNQNMFIAPDESTLTRSLGEPYMSIGAFDKGKMIGYRLVYIPKPTDEIVKKQNECDPSKMSKCVCFQSVAVMPKYTNQGIAQHMNEECIKTIKSLGYKHIIATCHPNNTNSLHILTKIGFNSSYQEYKLQNKKRFFILKNFI